jgi:16S rRNA (guanine527-N7)-methyltransferase
VTLLESLQKRCDFLEHVIKTVGLPNVQIVHSRAEDAGQDAKFREVYDVAVARAVAEMRVLGESTLKISLFVLLFMYMWFQLAFIF